MISDERIGNAQTIGRREVQSNYFSTLRNSSGELFAVLCDGSIDHANGRNAAVIAVQRCCRVFLRKTYYVSAEQFFLETAAETDKYIQDHIFIGKKPHLSLTMALFSNNRLCYFNVGLNMIFVYNGRSERHIGNTSALMDSKRYACGEYEIAPKNIVGILSTGAYTPLHPMERIQILESRGTAFEKAQAMIRAVNTKGLDNQQNATVILVE